MNPADYFSQNNLPASNLVPIQKPGANLVYLTDEFVLRVVRPELIEYINHEREAELSLKALDLGIKTAKPIVWDKSYSIWARLPGESIDDPEVCSPKLWYDLLDTLELLHQNPLEPLRESINAWTGDASLIDKTQDIAHWSEGEELKLHTLLSEPHTITAPRFIHGDAFANNIMVDKSDFVGLIDWGNAGWQSLEAECAYLEMPALTMALNRWHDLLDTTLLWKVRLNLSLEVASYGRMSTTKVRAAFEQVVRIAGS